MKASPSPFWRRGDPFVLGTGAALLLLLACVGGVVFLLAFRGLGFFWPRPLVLLETKEGKPLLGEPWESEPIPRTPEEAAAGAAPRTRTLYRTGNRKESGADFVWIEDGAVTGRSLPGDALYLERLEWGPSLGILKETREAGARAGGAGEEGFEVFRRLLRDSRAERRGRLAPRLEEAVRTVVLLLADGREVEIPLASVVRAVRPNVLGFLGRLSVYFSRLWEFLAAEPRESNTEGGIAPAILGTVLMVLVMTLAVVPLGIVAALYLHEYARQGPLVRLVRLSVTNLAGVPSIVFGMFGLAFFIYRVGGGIDRLFFADRLPAPTFGTGGILWASLTLALLTVPVVIVATEEALAAVPQGQREASLALGATRWQTIRRVVLPASLPGILTGLILAISRGTGEVAPLMITGVVKLAPDPLLDGTLPFLHLDRKFMHLGFHIYDVGFQSPNVEASKPMVYVTALLLLGLILLLNLAAILIRNRIRRRLAVGAF
ncbi:MAG TPA: phosphate ABC transporter permease PstA [Planctomycetota bacterium]|nr:phosphate ABC transporter permease PstA [Planctomycetota bacterium]